MTEPHEDTVATPPVAEPSAGRDIDPSPSPATNAEPAKKATNHSPSLVRRIAVGVVLLLAVAAGAWILLHHDAAPEATQAPPSGGPVPVQVVEVQPADVPVSSDFLAQTEPSQSVDLRARVGGTLMEAPFEEGQMVAEGDVLSPH